MIIYLYKKTHNKTGLQYLGITIRNPHIYKGSGIRWRNHIKKHGYDVTTEVLKECQSHDEVSVWGEYYSKLWDVVKSSDWANLIEERGTGGNTGNYKNKGVLLSEEHKSKMRGPRGPQSYKRISSKRGTSPMKDKFKHTEESLQKMRKPKLAGHSEKLTQVAKNRPRSPCAVCGKMYQVQHMAKHLKSH
jgi:hypothetical protein